MESISPIIIAIVSVALSFTLGLIFIYIRSNRIPNQFKNAESYKERAQYEQALKLYHKIIKKLEDISSKEKNAKNQFLAKSYLACGIIYENTGNKDASYEFYKKSTQSGIHLSTGMVSFMTSYCLEREVVDDYSINIFIHFLILKPSDRISQQIDLFLSKRLYIDDNSSDESVNQTLRICERILSTKIQNISNKTTNSDNITFEWVNYYAGLSYYFKKDFRKAISSLNLAIKSKKSRLISNYWLAMAMMAQLQADIDKQTTIEQSRYKAIIDMFTEFCSFESNEPEVIGKQKIVHHKLGIFIIKWILDSINDDEIKLSDEQINYVNLATSNLAYSILNDIKDDDSAYLFIGRAYSLLQDSIQAIENYKIAFDILPNQYLLFFYLGQEYFKLGQFKEAKDYLEKLLEKHENNIEARKLLLKINVLTNDYQAAEDDFKLLAKLNTVDKEIEFQYITALFHQNKFKEIINLVNCSSTTFSNEDLPHEVSFFIGRAFVYLELWKESLIYFQNLPKNPEYQYFHGYTLANIGLIKQAEVIINQLFSDNPDLQNRINLLSGNLYLSLKKYEKAKANYINAYSLQPDNAEINEALGCVFLNMGNLEDAKIHFNKALSINNLSYLSNVGLAHIHENQDEFQEAIEHLKIAFKYKEESWIQLKIGILYTLTEDFQSAQSYLESYSVINPNEDSCLYYLGYIYNKLEKYEEGIHKWVKLLERKPEDKQLQISILQARYKYGVKLIESKEYEKAITEWEIYVTSIDNDLKIKKNLAQLYFRVGLNKLNTENKEDLMAIKVNFFAKALIHDQHNPEFLFYLSLIEIKLGYNKEAQKILEKLNSMDPLNEKYRYYLSISHLETGNRQMALTILKEIMNSESSNGFSHFSKRIVANEYIKNLNFSEALILLEQVI